MAYPKVRATSSMTSSTPWGSGRTSGRLVGTITVSDPARSSSTVKPIGSSSCATSSAPSSTPIWVCTRSTGTVTAKGSGTSPRTSSMPSATLKEGTLSASNWQNRHTAGSIPQGSQPRSKRAEASERSPSRLDVRAIAIGVKYAASSSTSLVAVEISDDAPPITPAMPTGVPSASQMRQSSPVSPRLRPRTPTVRVAPSSVSTVSPGRARRTVRPRPGTLAMS